LAFEAQGNYTKAVDAYNLSMGIDPKYTQAMNNMMHAKLDLKKHDEAVKIFLKL